MVRETKFDPYWGYMIGPNGLEPASAKDWTTCVHSWTEPKRAANRFGRRSTSLYETSCSLCGRHEVRNGLARLKREVMSA